ncbi:hypothetical protein HMI56_006241 [Coelomomyces lativittatus]|nr:hypothetical protein HMI56_006241 [Coelomomyces lativittatus]
MVLYFIRLFLFLSILVYLQQNLLLAAPHPPLHEDSNVQTLTNSQADKSLEDSSLNSKNETSHPTDLQSTVIPTTIHDIKQPLEPLESKEREEKEKKKIKKELEQQQINEIMNFLKLQSIQKEKKKEPTEPLTPAEGPPSPLDEQKKPAHHPETSEVEVKDETSNEEKEVQEAPKDVENGGNPSSTLINPEVSIPEIPPSENLKKKPFSPSSSTEPSLVSSIKENKPISSPESEFLTRHGRDESGGEGRTIQFLDLDKEDVPQKIANPILENKVIDKQLNKKPSFFDHSQPTEEVDMLMPPPPPPPPSASSSNPVVLTTFPTQPAKKNRFFSSVPFTHPGELEEPSSTSKIQALLNPSITSNTKRFVRQAPLDVHSDTTSLSRGDATSHKEEDLVKEPNTKKHSSLEFHVLNTNENKKEEAPVSSSSSTSAPKPFVQAVPPISRESQRPLKTKKMLLPSQDDTPPSPLDTVLPSPSPLSPSPQLSHLQFNHFVSPLLANRQGRSLVVEKETSMVLTNFKVPLIRQASMTDVTAMPATKPNVCGNGICEMGETCETCRKDCGVVALDQLVVCSYAIQRCDVSLGKAVVLLGIPETKGKFMTPDTLPKAIASKYPIHRADSSRPIAILPRFEPPMSPAMTLKHSGLSSFVFAAAIRDIPNAVHVFLKNGFKIVSATKCKLGHDGSYLTMPDKFHWNLSSMD